jgi:maleate isomerase
MATIARLGVLTPDFDPVPESELTAMAPHGVSIHGARVPRTGGSGAGFVTAPYIDAAVDGLVELAPRAILLGYTSGSYMLGADADDRARARLEQRSKGIPLIFTSAAAATAFQQLGARRISLAIHPGGRMRRATKAPSTGAQPASTWWTARASSHRVPLRR